MGRTRIEIYKSLFDRLEQKVPKDMGIYKLETGENRTIYQGYEDDSADIEEKEKSAKGWIKDNRVKVVEFCLQNSPVFLLQHQSEYFVVFLVQDWDDFADKSFMNGVYGNVDINYGMLTVLWENNEYPLNQYEDLGMQLFNQVFGIYNDGKYEINSIKKFYKACSIWKVDNNVFNLSHSTVTELYRIYAGFTCATEYNLSLSYSKETLLKIKKILEGYPGDIVGQTIFRALTAVHWSQAYLEFYRCIENLYSFSYSHKLREMFDAGYDNKKISAVLENEIKWRPNELEALKRLCTYIKDKPYYQEIIEFFKIEIPKDSIDKIKEYIKGKPCYDEIIGILPKGKKNENGTDKIAEKIYKYRNGSAHWRPALEEIDYPNSSEEWDKLIGYICDIIYDLYIEMRSYITCN